MPEPAGAIGIVGRKLDQWRRHGRSIAGARARRSSARIPAMRGCYTELLPLAQGSSGRRFPGRDRFAPEGRADLALRQPQRVREIGLGCRGS
jgi:hypothetical protein